MRGLVNEGVVLHDGLSFVAYFDRGLPARVNLRGRVHCRDGVVLMVDKWLEVRRNARGQDEVRGYSYTYEAWRLPGENQVLRYDSSHGLDNLHRHSFDPVTGDEVEVVTIALDQLPTLDRVIREAAAPGTGQPPLAG